MTDTSIQAYRPGSGALSAEHYQTFEMAKANDDVLGGSDIAQIRSYAAYARAQAQAIHKTIAATSGIEDVAAIKEEATETAQTFAKVGIYADQRIGEILRELPKSDRWSDSPTGKTDAIKDAGFTPKTAYQLEQLAAHPDVVQAVIDKATEEGKVASRAQVLKAIRERDEAKDEAELLGEELEEARREITALEQQNDSLYEQAQAAKEPKVVERHVVPSDYESIRHERDLYLSDLQKLRRSNAELRGELDKANGILGMNQTMQNVRKDVQYLITATNSYVRQYGGLTWTAASLGQVDAQTLEELRKAATNLATFASALVASLEDFNG